MSYRTFGVKKRVKTQIGDFEKIWREIEKWETKKCLWNVWSDFFLDRWRKSGVIRMSAAVAGALIALKSDNPCYVPSGSKHLAGGYMLPGIYKQNSLVDLADFAPNVPCGVRSHDFRLLGT